MEDVDYKFYIRRLKRFKREYQIQIFGFCLMPNHVHLTVRPRETEGLSNFMKSLNQTYAQYFNGKYESVGHLWQGRYKSMIISDEDYLVECIKYIEFNPIRANLAQSPGQYPWCSYQHRIRGIHNGLLDPIENAFDSEFETERTERDSPKAK